MACRARNLCRIAFYNAMDNTNIEKWGIYEEKDGKRTRVGSATYTSRSQADTALTEARTRSGGMQEGAQAQPALVVKRILNG